MRRQHPLPPRDEPEFDPSPIDQGSSAQPLFGSNPEHEALIDEAVALFSRYYERPISKEQARQMTERLTAFFKLLIEWDNRAESPDKT